MKKLQSIVKECAKNAGIHSPLICGIRYPEKLLEKLPGPWSNPPASGLGGITGLFGIIMVSDRLLRILDEDETRFVIFHELSHIKHRDGPTKFVWEVIKHTILFPTWISWVCLRKLLGIKSITGSMNKNREFRADKEAVQWLDNKEKAVSALLKMCKNYSGGDKDKESQTHPTARERIDCIKSYRIR